MRQTSACLGRVILSNPISLELIRGLHHFILLLWNTVTPAYSDTPLTKEHFICIPYYTAHKAYSSRWL